MGKFIALSLSCVTLVAIMFFTMITIRMTPDQQNTMVAAMVAATYQIPLIFGMVALAVCITLPTVLLLSRQHSLSNPHRAQPIDMSYDDWRKTYYAANMQEERYRQLQYQNNQPQTQPQRPGRVASIRRQISNGISPDPVQVPMTMPQTSLHTNGTAYDMNGNGPYRDNNNNGIPDIEEEL